MRTKREKERTPEQRKRKEELELERDLEAGIDPKRVYDRRAKLKSKYGLSILEFHALLEAQEGKCAICRCECNDPRGYRLHVDHCHLKNQVRGLLCTNCNNGIGRFKDSPSLLRKAAEYLEKETP